jgi:hypothetical protein
MFLLDRPANLTPYPEARKQSELTASHEQPDSHSAISKVAIASYATALNALVKGSDLLLCIQNVQMRFPVPFLSTPSFK